ncbi:hypothetical protein ACH9D2_06610 [Kocuria sp. M4R2S49]|uniref:hypothetical protein n=1 Tax=Kocuria rhizosphaericola TaxID=3376284 RepID=UPI0037BB4F30
MTPIDPLAGQGHLDPRTTPAEAIVESEPGDSWSPGLRVAAGRAVAAAAESAGTPLPTKPELMLADLPVPYDILNGTGYDGRTLWHERTRLRLRETWFGAQRPPGPEPTDLWDSAELTYQADFHAGGTTLTLRRHDGGNLDWYSVDATAPLPPPIDPAPARSIYPSRLRFRGAPMPRWWQIEDATVDIGGYPPDRAHFATSLLIDLLVNRSDDWFSFPVEALAGHIVTLDEVVIHDSFGDTWPLSPPADWSMFATEGLDRTSLVLWGAAATPLTGPILDEIVIGIDEDANLVWAVEQRLRGRTVPSDDNPPPTPPANLDPTGRTHFAYHPTRRVPPRWHPYVLEDISGRRRYVQGRAADLSGPAPVLRPPAESDLLIDPASAGIHPTHQLEPSAIPQNGLRVERRTMLTRATDGSPVLWTQRRRQPLLTPPALRVQFDAMDPVPPHGSMP